MAAVTFGSTTIWNDATTGIGPVEPDAIRPMPRFEVVALPRNGGKVAKNLGTDPGRMVLVLRYSMSSSDANTLATTLDGMATAGVEKTLSVPPGQSYANALLIYHQMKRGRVREVGASATKEWEWMAVLVFERLR